MNNSGSGALFSEPESKRWEIEEWVVFAGLIGLAGFFRFHHLAGQSIWNDEIFSLRAAVLPFIKIQPQLRGVHPPLFFYLMHMAVTIGGTGEWWMRVVSAIAGTATVGLIYLAGKRYFGFAPALVSGLLLTIAPLHIAYSQEARPYALAGFFAVASVLSVVSMLERPDRWRTITVILSSLGILYSHHWGIFLLCAEAGCVIAFHRARVWEYRRLFIVACLGIAVGYLPEIPALFPHSQTLGTGHWFWVEQPNAHEIYNLAQAYGGGYFRMATASFRSLTDPMAIASGIAVFLAWLATGLLALHKRNTILLTFFGAASGALAIAFLVSFRRPELFLWYRYPVIFLPLMVLSLGWIISASRWPVVMALPLAVIGIVSGVNVVGYYGWQKSNVRDAVSYLNTLATRDEVQFVVRPAYESDIIGYYYRGEKPVLDETYLDGPLGAALDTAASFVLVTLDVPDEIRDAINKEYRLVEERTFPGEAHMGLVVGLYERTDMELFRKGRTGDLALSGPIPKSTGAGWSYPLPAP